MQTCLKPCQSCKRCRILVPSRVSCFLVIFVGRACDDTGDVKSRYKFQHQSVSKWNDGNQLNHSDCRSVLNKYSKRLWISEKTPCINKNGIKTTSKSLNFQWLVLRCVVTKTRKGFWRVVSPSPKHTLLWHRVSRHTRCFPLDSDSSKHLSSSIIKVHFCLLSQSFLQVQLRLTTCGSFPEKSRF